MEKKSDNHVHGQLGSNLGWIPIFKRFKSSLVPSQQVQIHLQVSRDTAQVVKCVVK
jgi:hypothetical protein